MLALSSTRFAAVLLFQFAPSGLRFVIDNHEYTGVRPKVKSNLRIRPKIRTRIEDFISSRNGYLRVLDCYYIGYQTVS